MAYVVPMNSRPPPPPPSPAKPSSDLFALTAKPFTAPVATPMPPAVAPAAEELSDLADDDVEMWAMGGTKIIDQPKAPSVAPPPVAPVATPPQLAATMAADAPPASIAPSFIPPPPYPQSHSYPPVAMAATMPASIAPMPPKKTNWLLWIAAASLVGLFGLVAVGGGAAYWVYRSNQAQAELDENLAKAAAVQQTNDVTTNDDVAPRNDDTDDTAKTDPPVTNHTTTTLTVHGTTTVTTPHTTPAPTVTTTTNTARPATTATTTPAPAKPAAKKGDGTLQTFAAGRGQPIIVDGTQVGVGGTRVSVSCGMHQIAVGTGKAKIVDVPCDGTVTVGSPDGS